MEILWLIFCAIVIWLWLYRNEKRDNNGIVDGFDIALITIFSAMLSLLGNLVVVLACGLIVMIYHAPVKITLFTFLSLAIVIWLFKKFDSFLSWISCRVKLYIEERELRKFKNPDPLEIYLRKGGKLLLD